MPVYLMTGAARPEWLTVRPSPLAELCAALHALDEPEHHPASHAWVSAVHQGIAEELLTRATTWASLWGPFRARYLLPLAAGPERSLRAELDGIAGLPVEAFTTLTLEALIGQNRPSGDPPRQPAVLLKRLRLISLGRYHLGVRLIDAPDRFRDDLLQFLDAFAAAAFEAEWRRVKSIVDGDVQARRRQLHLHGVAAAFGGIGTPLTDPPGVVVDKRYHARAWLDERTPGVLVPSVHADPHLVVKHVAGYPVVVQYPVAHGAETVSAEQVRQRLAVLTDPTRLTICRGLLRQPAATAELAARLGMTAPQISRHLRRLREAGLVSTHREGSVVYYRLSVDAIGRLGLDLLAGLRR